MAEALFNARAQREGESDSFYAESAGTWAPDNHAASDHAITSMAKRRIDLNQHVSRTVNLNLLTQASVIIVMTRNHYDALHAEFPAQRAKLHLISELQDRQYDISDPYGGTLDEYERCAQQLETLIANGYVKIKAWATAHVPVA